MTRVTRVPRETLACWPDADYAQLETTLRERSGLIFQPMRRSAVEAAAGRVMRRVGIGSPQAFLPLVRQDGAIFDDLLAEVTIGETYFFREPAHFTLLRGTIVPEFKARASGGQRFRAWSAACSTGEEPYSVAMALREEGVPADVVGTDVSRARLAAARRGEYRRWSFRGVPPATVERYFQPLGDALLLVSDVRRDVDFRYLNLASDCYPDMATAVWGMDLILCRNVLIYFDRDTIAHVAQSLIASLAVDGWLLLGATDPPLHEFVRCEVVQTDAGLAYRHFRGAAHRSIRTTSPAALPATPVLAPPIAVPPPVAAAPAAAPAAEPTPPVAPPIVAAAAAPEAAPADAYARRDYATTIDLVAPRAASGVAPPAELVLNIRALANLGRLDDAGRACAAALDRHRDVAELHYLHAVLLAQAGHYAESARAARRAVYLDRSMIVAHLALGSALARSDNAEGAMRAFAASERLLSAMPPDDPVAGTDGEPAGRLLEMTRMQVRLARREDAA